MAKSHPAQFDDQGVPRPARGARNTVLSLVLMACLVSLAIILHHQHGVRLPDSVSQGLVAMNLSSLVPSRVTPVSEDDAAPAVDPDLPKHRAIGEYLARRYRVSVEAATDIVAKAHVVGREFKIDPMLILAVISVESRFNPIAESTMGAKGLMQVIPRFHPDKFDPLGGEKVAFEPEANIIVGARILKEYMRHAGDIGGALRMYVGASTDDNENGYSTKVMLERDRLNHILRQYLDRNIRQTRVDATRQAAPI